MERPSLRRGRLRVRGRRPGEGLPLDPLEGVANLFDVAMVFAVALLVALVTALNLPEMLASASVTVVKDPGTPNMEVVIKRGERLERYRIGEHRAGGEGERIGSCYRLRSGEIIYVPEGAEAGE